MLPDSKSDLRLQPHGWVFQECSMATRICQLYVRWLDPGYTAGNTASSRLYL